MFVSLVDSLKWAVWVIWYRVWMDLGWNMSIAISPTKLLLRPHFFRNAFFDKNTPDCWNPITQQKFISILYLFFFMNGFHCVSVQVAQWKLVYVMLNFFFICVFQSKYATENYLHCIINYIYIIKKSYEWIKSITK